MFGKRGFHTHRLLRSVRIVVLLHHLQAAATAALPCVCPQHHVCCPHLAALLLQAEDGTTTLPQRLPKALQQAILQQVSEENASPELLGVLVRCAADIQQAQEQQLAQQQGEIVQLRRELRGVQASLGSCAAAVARPSNGPDLGMTNSSLVHALLCVACGGGSSILACCFCLSQVRPGSGFVLCAGDTVVSKSYKFVRGGS